ncbi:MAG: HAD hydrolase-like protein [Terriglobales bacterium]
MPVGSLGQIASVNILFDLDGTLTDPRDGIVRCIQYALDKLGLPPRSEADLLHCIGPPLRESFAELLGTPDCAKLDHAINIYRERYSTIGLFENEVYAGIPEALCALSARGDALFVATSKPEIYAQQILEHFGLATYFRHVWGCELNGTRADKGELIAHLLDQEKLRPLDTVMIGDRLHDAVGARANGVFPIGVLWGYGDEAELIAAQCKMLVRAPEELSRLVV